jgi:hypothetical protein
MRGTGANLHQQNDKIAIEVAELNFYGVLP